MNPPGKGRGAHLIYCTFSIRYGKRSYLTLDVMAPIYFDR